MLPWDGFSLARITQEDIGYGIRFSESGGGLSLTFFLTFIVTIRVGATGAFREILAFIITIPLNLGFPPNADESFSQIMSLARPTLGWGTLWANP